MAQSQGGMFFPPRRSVTVTEPVGLEANWRLPRNEAWLGVTGSALMMLISGAWAAWVTPPDVALPTAGFLALVLGLHAAYQAVVFIADEIKTNDEQAREAMLYGTVAIVCGAGLFWLLASRPRAWWGDADVALPINILGAIQYIVCAALFLGGRAGYRWFTRELNDRYELTGEQKLQWAIYQEERADRYEIVELRERVGELEAEKQALKDALRKEQTERPLLNVNALPETGAEFLRWQLCVLQMLLAGELGIGHTQNSWTPGGKPTHTLPLTNTLVKDAMVRHVYRALRQADVGGKRVAVSARNQTTLNQNLPPMVIIEAAGMIEPWPGFDKD